MKQNDTGYSKFMQICFYIRFYVMMFVGLKNEII